MQRKDRLQGVLIKDLKESRFAYEVGQLEAPKQTWKSLFSKLDLEEFLAEMDLNADFPKLYAKVHLARTNVNDLIITMKPVTNIQSGYHFLTSVIEQMEGVVELGFSGKPNTQVRLPKKTFKAVYKGLNNLATRDNKLTKIKFYNLAGSDNE